MNKSVNRIVVTLSFGMLATASCRQNPEKTVNEIIPPRVQVSVKDSSIMSIDKSPMDMIYFPEDYPKQKMVTPDIPNPVIRIIYSRPHQNGRTIFADSSQNINVIQHYGEEWRLGANEATEIEFFKPVNINGNKLNPGRYVMYCIPTPGKWTIIFNSNLYSWGLHMDKAKDKASVEIPVLQNSTRVEYFTMRFQTATYGCDLVMAWGNVKAVLPIKFDNSN